MVMQDAMNLVGKFDPEVGAMIRKEYDRQVRNIELIASENIVSEAVLAAISTPRVIRASATTVAVSASMR